MKEVQAYQELNLYLQYEKGNLIQITWIRFQNYCMFLDHVTKAN